MLAGTCRAQVESIERPERRVLMLVSIVYRDYRNLQNRNCSRDVRMSPYAYTAEVLKRMEFPE